MYVSQQQTESRNWRPLHFLHTVVVVVVVVGYFTYTLTWFDLVWFGEWKIPEQMSHCNVLISFYTESNRLPNEIERMRNYFSIEISHTTFSLFVNFFWVDWIDFTNVWIFSSLFRFCELVAGCLCCDMVLVSFYFCGKYWFYSCNTVTMNELKWTQYAIVPR